MKKYKYEKKITIAGKQYRVRADTLTELGQKIERKKEKLKKEA